MRKVYIMRGICNEQRVEWVKKNFNGAGGIDWVAALEDFIRLVGRDSTLPLIVNLPNIQLHELAAYVNVARAVGARITVVTCACSPLLAHRFGGDLDDLESDAQHLRAATLPEEWSATVTEIICANVQDGWYLPTIAVTDKGTIEDLRRELRRFSPSVPRLRMLAGL